MKTRGTDKKSIAQGLRMSLSRLALGMVLLLSACAPVKTPAVVETPPALVKLTPSAYPALPDDLNYEGLNRCIQMSLAYLRKLPRDRAFSFGTDSYTAAHLIRSLEVFQEFIQTGPSADQITAMIRSDFEVYRAAGASEKVLFTGYYEPVLKGSLKETPHYRYPIYSRPDDLIAVDLSAFSAKYAGETITGRFTGQTLVPYYDRKTIENREIFKGQALAWVGDPVDLFFLHIQGSGKIMLDQGKILNVHYHATNGHPYRSIGKVLIDQGKIPKSEISMQAIRAYLKSHPEEQDTVLSANPSFVFFKTETDGPLGNLNVPLTPGRSLAVDKKIFPPAALMYIQAQKPVMTEPGQLGAWEDFGRFALNQDTGGAITGPGRADIFWGNGPYAELAAGHLQHRGDMYFLILKPTALP
ncbi:MAG: MltA domain-containing protein [Deltaproteobacteria bacterium]|nr:MltA domain-containing protein [Deltaproteobacteria bacterium]